MEDGTSLIKMKAGKSKLDAKLLVADKRKGMLEVLRDQDGLVHFTWGVRQAASDSTPRLEPEFDLVLFPGQATFSKLGGRRMFVLKYEKEEHFFWSQEPDCGQDEEMCKTVHECINSFVPDQSNDEADEEMVARALGGAAEEEGAAAQPQQQEGNAETASETQQGIQAADLARVLGSLQAQQGQGQGQGGPVNAAALAAALAGMRGAGSTGQMQMQRAPGPSLAEVLNPETMILLLRQPGMLEKLAQYLPEEQRTEPDLADLAGSAQLHAQLRILGAALQTAQLDPAQFGLDARGYTVVDFFEAIQKKVDEEKKGAAPP